MQKYEPRRYDPPYIHLTRGDHNAYGYEMTDDEHRDLARVLNSAKGQVAISNYQCELMDELYPAPKWVKSVASEKTIHSTKGRRAEALWTNYDPLKQGGKVRLKEAFLALRQAAESDE